MTALAPAVVLRPATSAGGSDVAPVGAKSMLSRLGRGTGSATGAGGASAAWATAGRFGLAAGAMPGITFGAAAFGFAGTAARLRRGGAASGWE